jgi:hypothetical protein
MDTKRFDFQVKMLEKGVEELERQISRLDEILFKLKSSAVTIWIAIIGWGVTTNKASIIPLGFVTLIGFWLIEGLFRRVQISYIHESKEVIKFLNDSQRLDESFSNLKLPERLIYPLSFGTQNTQLGKLRLFFRSLISTSVITLYLFLGFVNLLIWVAFSA